MSSVDFIIPVYNEGKNIARAIAEIDQKVPLSKRVLVVYDFDGDDTVPAVRELQPRYPYVSLLKNDIGRGVLNAVRSGIAAATAEVVVISMADLSDDIAVVPEMARLIREEGHDIVCASRYCKGGRQIGGPKFKKFLSRMAGLSLHWLTGLPTHDATNAFRGYRREVLQSIPIESRGGFEYSLEITAKAYARGYRVTETPSTWRDRSAGTSRFQLIRWLPHYLRWYWWAIRHRPRREVSQPN
jgi:glycosyltransferase involved in cell wall biosynthesis